VSTAKVAGNNMRMETKFLRLRTPVELGSRFGDWSVCWLGGWSKHRLYYLIMVVKLEPFFFPPPTGTGPNPLSTHESRSGKPKKAPPGAMTWRRSSGPPAVLSGYAGEARTIFLPSADRY
jgi:hypothetical protein